MYYMFECFCGDVCYCVCGFLMDVIMVFYKYDWLGNVCELINCVCWVVVMMEGCLIIV